MRPSYNVCLKFEGIKINEVIIDQHYTAKHFGVSDWIILELVKELEYQQLEVKNERGNFIYYKAEPLFHNDKPYRLVFLLEKDCHYIGVINAFRVQEKKHGISR